MIFQHSLPQVLDGTKNQTRRLVKPGDIGVPAWSRAEAEAAQIKSEAPIFYVKRNGRKLWQVGSTYAVQPGRGKKSVGRIRITAIRQERLQEISEKSAEREGCYSAGFWYAAYPGTAPDWIEEFAVGEFIKIWDKIHSKPGTRWEDNPAVWVLTFELVKE